MTVVAFLDANVLYQATVRSVLIELARVKVFRPLWSERVHQEWTAALIRDRPDLSQAQIARTRALMEAHVDDAMVTGYEPITATLTLPDADDRHVLAAAIHGGAVVIITANLKHFPAAVLSNHSITAEHPDTFVCGLLSTYPQSSITAFATDRARMTRPAMTVDEYLAALERAGLITTAAALRAHSNQL